ncbi:unnamed protein product [Lactuca saligna]|uniref:Uncharacterized protein n=1 Tax=Lactuca saligna TaxID=75948 RepID=A0AA35VS76_LACSI|nr:unnamed protein product [Lactuca saligna]
MWSCRPYLSIIPSIPMNPSFVFFKGKDENVVFFICWKQGCAKVDSSKDCKFFDWVDPPLSNQWYKDLLLQLHNGWNGDVVEQMEEAIVEVVPAQVQGAGGVVPRWSMLWFILGLCFGLYFKII